MTDKLQKTRDAINKKMGAGTLMRLSDLPQQVDSFSSGVLGLDLAMGVGGWPRGKVVEMFGPESSGKTTLALMLIIEAQKEGYPGVFIDMEHALKREYAEALGVDLDKLFISQPQTGEQALEIAESIVGSAGAVVIDSVPALVPQSRIEGEMTDKNYGDIAALLSRTLKKLKSAAQKGNGIILFLNQLRVKFGAVSRIPGYVVMKTYGGEALKFYTDMRVELKRKLDSDKEIRMEKQDIIAEVIKSKVAAPFRKAQFSLEYGVGVDKMQDLVTVAVEKGIIEKNGSWYSFRHLKAHGVPNFLEALHTESSELVGEIKEKVLR